jgi:hypothetical protein
MAGEFLSREEMEVVIHSGIKLIAKQSALVGVDNTFWDVTSISWTGSEWPGLRSIPGLCYVEAFEHANPPHDFIFVVSVHGGEARFVACYEGDIDFFELTLLLRDAEMFDFPERIPR